MGLLFEVVGKMSGDREGRTPDGRTWLGGERALKTEFAPSTDIRVERVTSSECFKVTGKADSRRFRRTRPWRGVSGAAWVRGSPATAGRST